MSHTRRRSRRPGEQERPRTSPAPSAESTPKRSPCMGTALVPCPQLHASMGEEFPSPTAHETPLPDPCGDLPFAPAPPPPVPESPARMSPTRNAAPAPEPPPQTFIEPPRPLPSELPDPLPESLPGTLDASLTASASSVSPDAWVLPIGFFPPALFYTALTVAGLIALVVAHLPTAATFLLTLFFWATLLDSLRLFLNTSWSGLLRGLRDPAQLLTPTWSIPRREE